MSRQTKQDQENTIPQDPVYQTISPATFADPTYMGLQPLNHADMSTQTQHNESQAYQPLSRETMETSSGYTSLNPPYNQTRSSVSQGDDDYENPDQGYSSQDGHQSNENEITIDLQEGEYLEIVG
ncbi:uncharacterized protein LOC144909201 [Branchiostoma floridae x Branchiostoma belcheri]